ncbi:MAG: GntR family transcriptional regulator [Tepidisphaeraceae bacterium]
MIGVTAQESQRRRRAQSEFSYKFQRLRERIRQAVASGELQGKLPGERNLARRFQVNAKTLSKALTDLAAEGLLSRSIGRGTFVKGATDDSTSQGSWLVVSDGNPATAPLIAALRRRNPQLEVIQSVANLRPSFLNQFSGVIDLAPGTPQDFVRDMLVRNLPLVVVGREPQTYSTNAALLDVSYLAGRLARELIMAGHRRLAVVQDESPATGTDSTPTQAEQFASVPPLQDTMISKALRSTAARYGPEATVANCRRNEVVSLIEQGVTALVCSSPAAAADVRRSLSDAGFAVPGVVSVAAIGTADSEYPCTGFYLSGDEEAEAVIHLLHNAKASGAAVLWLTGKYVDQGTTGPAPAPAGAAPPVLTLTA